MKCPKCEAEMEKVVFERIEVDRCSKCKGIWFDMLEHEELKKIKGSEAIDIGDPEIGKEYNKIDQIKCPKCNVKMLRMVDPNQPHIWYESCGVCYGTFFDAGEFKDFKTQTFLDFLKSFTVKERT